MKSHMCGKLTDLEIALLPKYSCNKTVNCINWGFISLY